MNNRKKVLSLLLIVSLFVGMVGIINVDTSYAASKKKTHIMSKTVSMYVGENYQQKLLSSKGKIIKAKKVKWKSKNTAVAIIDKKGKITGVNAGTAKMTAKYKGKTYKFTVKVNKKPTPTSTQTQTQTPTIEPTGITIVPDLSEGFKYYDWVGEYDMVEVPLGKTLQLNVEIYPSNATNKTVNWYSNTDPDVIELNNGKATAKKAGSSLISVATYDYNYTASIYINVTVEPTADEAREQLRKYILEKGKEVTSGSGLIGDYYIESRSSATSTQNRIVVSAYLDNETIVMYSIANDNTKYVLFHNQPDEEQGIDDFDYDTNEKPTGSWIPTSYWGKITINQYAAGLYGNEQGITNCRKTGPADVTDTTELYKVYRKASDSMKEFDSFLKTKMGFGLKTIGYSNM